jgi:hypothetical protein
MWMTNLFRAFSILLVGSAVEIGEGYRWKSGLLRLVICISAFFPVVNMLNAAPYQGNPPPLVPLISGNGRIEFLREKQGAKLISYAEFIGQNERKYVFQDYSSLLGVEKFVNEHPERNLHVEGFILKNGEGLFWPTSISTVDGQVLLTPEKVSRDLEINRSVWGRVFLLQQISLMPLWIISFFNVVKIARKLRKGEIR